MRQQRPRNSTSKEQKGPTGTGKRALLVLAKEPYLYWQKSPTCTGKRALFVLAYLSDANGLVGGEEFCPSCDKFNSESCLFINISTCMCV